ncbi:ribosome-associated translation inhibitor RaiA [Jatrophihabitans endophyticus]|uniref:ribosome hibernation-promoting factor, HPF/YfiA family n=1 Tax=Jatrophihabitans endophyticus TaxID=1206085 RepID=UPI0019EEBCF4|nr:ribosome-associated translation inhibitor RaiA [Jatrophihabitans endophyticus]
MEIVVRGRNVEVPDHFRSHVAEKLAKLERYDGKIHRTDVELQHEKNPRQNGSCQHVEITCRTRGPVVRGEACSDDFYKALDIAVERLERRFRQAADRRRIHHGRRTPPSVAQATAGLPDDLAVPPGALDGAGAADAGAEVDEYGPGRIARRKEHDAQPMSVDQALEQMELVGHDFFLFKDVETDCASVVYRRHAYDYGLIRLTG